VSVNGFGLQAFELEMLQMGAVRAGKWRGHSHRDTSTWESSR
jgi:hypothetical protein